MSPHYFALPAGARPVRGQAVYSRDLFSIVPAGLTPSDSVGGLDRILADTVRLCGLYRHLQQQLAGSHLYELHLLFRKHGEEQSIAAGAVLSRIHSDRQSPPVPATDSGESALGNESLPAQISQLLAAHEALLTLAYDTADRQGDSATRNLIVNQIVRPNEFHVWCLMEQMANLTRFSA